MVTSYHRCTENPYKLHRELGEIMTANVTVVRENEKLLETDKRILIDETL
ncbi:hypothetical protein ACVQ9Z_10950 [Staphylococcus aureus]